MKGQQTLGGRYKLLNELGSGGMAVVWRARDEVLGRQVAVKLLAGRYAGDPPSRARIRDEARAAATLSHPNVAQIYDFGESDESGTCLPYVVMELVKGPTLAQRLSRGRLPPRTVLRICGEVAAALAAAHADGLVHRDIKPANVMLTPAGAKVVDFGIAALAGPAEPDEKLLGTPAYLAPERLTGDAVTPASDVYALGILLYRLLADQSPWSVDSTTQMLDAHVYVEPDPLPPLPSVPPAVVDLVHRCLRKDPAERPSAARASSILADAAEASVEQDPAPAVRGERGSIPTGTGADSSDAGADAADRVGEARRRRLLLAGVGVLVLLGAALLAWILVPADGGGGPHNAAIVPAGPLQPSAGDRGTPSGGPAVDSTGPADTGTMPATGVAGLQPAGGPNGIAASAAGPGDVTGMVTAWPTGTQPTTTATAGTTEPPSQSKTFTSAGGSVVAECTSGKAVLTSWTPKEPYQVEWVRAGPATAAEIMFRNDASRIRMTVTCVADAPTAVVLPL